jgi:hypothetical protein
MRHCENCGVAINEGDTFCNACGAKINQAAPPQPVRPTAPPAPLPVSQPASPPPVVSKPPSSGGKALWYVISGVLVVALIAVGVLYGSTSGKLKTANTENSSLNNQVSSLQKNVDSLNAQLTAEKANSASLTTQLNAANANVTKLTADLATANTSLTASQNQAKTLQTSLDTATANVTKLTADLATANGKVTSTQANLDKANADLTKAKADLTTAQTQLTSAQTQLASVQAQLTALQAKYPPKSFPDVAALQTWVNNNITLISTAATSSGLAPLFAVQNKGLSDGWIVTLAVVPNSTGGGSLYLQAFVGTTSVYYISLGTSPGTLVRVLS